MLGHTPFATGALADPISQGSSLVPTGVTPCFDVDLLSAIQRKLIEPVNQGQTIPSGLWTPQELKDALVYKQNEFIRRTQVVAAWFQIAVLSGAPTFALPEDWIATLDIAVDTGTRGYPLPPADNWQSDRMIPTWQATSGLPRVYSEGDDPDALAGRLAPVPNQNLILRGLYISLAEALDGSGVPLAVPDAACPVILWGALGVLLAKLGRATDLPRAAYCHQRFEEGVIAWSLLLEGVI